LLVGSYIIKNKKLNTFQFLSPLGFSFAAPNFSHHMLCNYSWVLILHEIISCNFADMMNILNSAFKRCLLIHRYYKISRFYSFLKSIVYRSFFLIVIFVLLLISVKFFIVDINLVLNNIVERFSPIIVFLFFLISESILGLIPPEIFILWSSKSAYPELFLFLLATASYIGGVLSYLIGIQISYLPIISKYIKLKISQHILNLRKWGGIFIVVGALSPIPHSVVSIGAGLIGYKFKYYLLWSLFRYLRFVIYYFIILNVL